MLMDDGWRPEMALAEQAGYFDLGGLRKAAFVGTPPETAVSGAGHAVDGYCELLAPTPRSQRWFTPCRIRSVTSAVG